MRRRQYLLLVALATMAFLLACGEECEENNSDNGASADKSLVLYFNFDEGKGDVVKDLSQYKNDGKIYGALRWVKGKSDGALLFKANGMVEVPDDDDSLDLIDAHTISYWLKWDGSLTRWSPFISKTAAEADDNYHTWVGYDHFWDYCNDNNAQVHGRSIIPLDDKWIFLTVTHDGKETVSFYIDGSLDSTAKLSTFKSNDAPFRIGFDGFSVGKFGAGTMDELSVFNRALNENEIRTLMGQGGKVFTAVESTGGS